MTEFDVIICGAGPAGCATALALLNEGVERVAIIDKPKPQRFKIGESAAPDVTAKLRRLGFEINLKNRGHAPYHGNISYWAEQKNHTDFLLHGRGQAWHLNRNCFDQDLADHAQKLGAHLLLETTLNRFIHDGNLWCLNLTQNDHQYTLKGKYLVDASGRRSLIARKLNAQRKQLDTLTAIAFKTQNVQSLKGRTLVESFSDGWWYASQLPTGEGLITLMTDADQIRKHQWQDPARLLKELQKTELIKEYFSVDTVNNVSTQTYAAQAGFLTQAAGPGWIAIGDALASFDPLTSSGISNALGDALAAVPAITGWLNNQDLAPAEKYAVRADSGIQRYLQESRWYYGLEKRWQDNEFWQRRQSQ